ncbi:hypothetical protein TELCIR_21582, partial [Teladorsagia circumcincta]
MDIEGIPPNFYIRCIAGSERISRTRVVTIAMLSEASSNEYSRQAPEVVATHIYTRECDVYSYGILVWEIFNDAKMPFEEYDNKTVRQR